MTGAEWVVGFHPVIAALKHQASRIERVLIAEGTVGGKARRVMDLARAAGVRYQASPRRQLDEVAGSLAHNGFAARVAPVPFVDVDEMLDIPAPVCLLGLDGIEDGRNLGAVIRVAAACELGGVVVGGPHPPPLGGAAAKVAGGSLPVVSVGQVAIFHRNLHLGSCLSRDFNLLLQRFSGRDIIVLILSAFLYQP